MSAGRFEWEATRYEHVDYASGLWLALKMDGIRWVWELRMSGKPEPLAQGSEVRLHLAKHDARKALESFKTKRSPS